MGKREKKNESEKTRERRSEAPQSSSKQVSNFTISACMSVRVCSLTESKATCDEQDHNGNLHPHSHN